MNLWTWWQMPGSSAQTRKTMKSVFGNKKPQKPPTKNNWLRNLHKRCSQNFKFHSLKYPFLFISGRYNSKQNWNNCIILQFKKIIPKISKVPKNQFNFRFVTFLFPNLFCPTYQGKKIKIQIFVMTKSVTNRDTLMGTQAFFTKLYDAWLNLPPPPHPQYD